MKLVDEFCDEGDARRLAALLAKKVTRPWTVMEVCGGQTHAIVRHGIDRLLPDGLTLLHGPGCPVCVTPVEVIDEALRLARDPRVILCSFGDMLRVPGTSSDLLRERAAGADVRVLYSPLDALAIAQAHADRIVVVLAVGFETTAPAHAVLVLRAAALGLDNLCLLVAHVLVPPALTIILDSGGHRTDAPRIDGFLAAGHVCTVMGTRAYEPLAARFRVPIVVTGFLPTDILRGLVLVVDQLESGRAVVENAYDRVVAAEGNPRARALVEQVFEEAPRRWRGLGDLPASGLRLRDAFARFDAEHRFRPVSLPVLVEDDPQGCQAGRVLTGRLQPNECPAFGTRCTPEHPLGAPMVSSEGACAAFARYRGFDVSDKRESIP